VFYYFEKLQLYDYFEHHKLGPRPSCSKQVKAGILKSREHYSARDSGIEQYSARLMFSGTKTKVKTRLMFSGKLN
jgi:hypothetical protein